MNVKEQGAKAKVKDVHTSCIPYQYQFISLHVRGWQSHARGGRNAGEWRRILHARNIVNVRAWWWWCKPPLTPKLRRKTRIVRRQVATLPPGMLGVQRGILNHLARVSVNKLEQLVHNARLVRLHAHALQHVPHRRGVPRLWFRWCRVLRHCAVGGEGERGIIMTPEAKKDWAKGWRKGKGDLQ